MDFYSIYQWLFLVTPADVLSNLYANEFCFEGVRCGNH